MKMVTAAVLLAALAGCSQRGEGESAGDFANRVGSGTSAAPASVAEVNAQPVVAPTGKALLTPLTASAPQAMGAVATTCAFAYQGRTLLVAGADDASGAGARGVLVIDGKETALPGAPSGARQVLANGITLSADGYLVKVMPGAKAMLSIAGPRGQTNFAPGTWSCNR